jgi:hypothetical protein
LERISWLYYFQLDRFIFERESEVWQFYLRNRLFCKHIASIKLLVIVSGNYLILNKYYTLEKMYKWLKIELSFLSLPNKVWEICLGDLLFLLCFLLLLLLLFSFFFLLSFRGPRTCPWQISGTTGQNFMKLCGVIDICF